MIERRLVGRQVTTLGTIPAPFRTATDGPPIITRGLVGYWNAGSPYSYIGTGTTWSDISGGGNTGTLTSMSASAWSADRKGIITFDGTDDRVAVTGTWTISEATFLAVVRRNGTQTSYCGIMYSRNGTGGNPGDDVNGMHLYSTTHNLTYTWEAQPGTYDWNSGLTVPDGQWCMVAVSVTSSDATAYLCTASGITTATNTKTHAASSINALFLGCDVVTPTTFRSWKGDVGVFCLYDKALDQSEVYANFNSFRGRFNI